MNKGLLVDIGGTNMTYAIASNNQEDISKINKTEFDTLDFETFLRKLVVDNEIDTLIISIAGPKINNSIRMTNRDYSINSDHLSDNNFTSEIYTRFETFKRDYKDLPKGSYVDPSYYKIYKSNFTSLWIKNFVKFFLRRIKIQI